MTIQLTEEDQDELQAFLNIVVWSGFSTPEEALEALLDTAEDEGFSDALNEISEAEWKDIVDEEFNKKRTAELSWPAETDCTRLTRAFEQLTAGGIVSLENAGMTLSDGWSDFQEIVHSEWEPEGKLGSVRGGCFYHSQDLERAVAGDGLTLAFGSVTDKESDTIDVANEIIRVLKSHGFTPEWSGSIDERIDLPITWHRRYAPPADTSPPD